MTKTMTIKEFMTLNKHQLTEQEQRASESLELILKASILVSMGVIAADTMTAVESVMDAFNQGVEVVTAFKIK